MSSVTYFSVALFLSKNRFLSDPTTKRDVIGRKCQPVEKMEIFSNNLLLCFIIVLEYLTTVLLVKFLQHRAADL